MDRETITYRGKEFPLTKYGCNANIRINLLSDNLMRIARFTDYREGYWYFCKDLRPLAHGISFNLSIKKDDPTDWRIDILDEDFCQPYDYQWMIKRELEGERFDGDFHWRINEEVELIMEHLKREPELVNGEFVYLLEGWEKGDYI